MRTLRSTTLGLLLLGATAWAGDFSFEPVSGLPEGLPAATAELLSADGVAVKGSDGEVVARYWGRKTPFEGQPASGFGIRFDTIPRGCADRGGEFPRERLGLS